MNDAAKSRISSILQPFDFGRVSFRALAGFVAAADGFCWGMYWETARVSSINPLGTVSLSYHLGLLAYTLFTLFLVLIAGAVLNKFIKKGEWSEMERSVFYSVALFGIVTLMTGFEFLFWLDWQYSNPLFFLLIKAAFSGLLVVFIVRIARDLIHD